MASKVLVISVVLLFSIAVVGAIPKYELRSESQDDVNCTDIINRVKSHDFCPLYLDIISANYLYKHYPHATEDFYCNVSQRLTAFCASQCKRIVVAYFNCHDYTAEANFLNYGTCGKINQEFCYVHYLRGTAAGTIVTYNTLRNICLYYRNFQYCSGGVCQRNMTQWANYMGCCARSLLRTRFYVGTCGITNTTPCPSGTVAISSCGTTNTTPCPSGTVAISSCGTTNTTPCPSGTVAISSCGITDTTPCSSGTVAISSSVFIMIAMAIIQMYWM